MNTIQIAYINALLADASYIRLQKGEASELPTNILLTGKDLSDRLTKSLTQPQADYLLANFEILTQTLSPTGGFDAVVWKGKKNTEFADKVYVSMRGTQGSTDLMNDADLFSKGVPIQQIVSMVNWWLTSTASASNTQVIQIKANYTIVPGTSALGTPTSTSVFTGFALDKMSQGTGQLSNVSSIADVNGHSLGGYLATAFTRLFGNGWNVEHTSTFSAGFRTAETQNIEKWFSEIQTLIGTSLGRTRFNTNAEQDNFFAQNGVNLTTNAAQGMVGFTQQGQRLGLYQEEGTGLPNHSIYKQTDLLALGAALEKLDPSLTFDKLNSLVKAGSNDMKASYEGVLDSARRLIGVPKTIPTQLGDVGDNADSRADFHTKLIDLQINTTFKALADKLTLSAQAASAGDACAPSGRFEGAHKVHELRNSCLRTRKKKITFSGPRVCQAALSCEYRVSDHRTSRGPHAEFD